MGIIGFLYPAGMAEKACTSEFPLPQRFWFTATITADDMTYIISARQAKTIIRFSFMVYLPNKIVNYIRYTVGECLLLN
jgi:hypothetical protein